MIVAVDSMILIWGMRARKPGDKSSKELQDLETRAQILFEMLDEEEDEIMVPTVAVAELLAGVAPEDQARFLSEIHEQFFCPAFDLPAAAIAAQLWQAHKSLPKSDQYKDRRVLKSDVLIIATAKSASARAIYSHEPAFRKLAESVGLDPHDLPTHHPDMFRNKELKGGTF